MNVPTACAVQPATGGVEMFRELEVARQHVDVRRHLGIARSAQRGRVAWTSCTVVPGRQVNWTMSSESTAMLSRPRLGDSSRWCRGFVMRALLRPESSGLMKRPTMLTRARPSKESPVLLNFFPFP